ncbi:MAG: redoxin domain-containing protein [Candidatus Eisenbacteria bacterium]|uniref:Redoxin domain-containing protein n=1 Tax=Eiseniibacteriota bacterium TaxID=2212470 RepID=A0A956M2C4_UNCEI|nr:redoxin domain-containing protein [Candidatus Eisenbacteria bacterium]
MISRLPTPTILILSIWMAFVVSGTCVADARAQETYPERAVCQTCTMKGHGHGEEKVAAFSRYEGTSYYFCSQGCKEEFDADPVGFLPPVFPRPAPAVQLRSLDGASVSLDQYRGRVVLLDFWATWCKPCVKAMPELAKLQERFGGRGFTVLGISIDEKPEKVPPFLEKRHLPYPVLLDTTDEPAWSSFRVKSIPAVFLLDRKGAVQAQWIGDVSTDDLTQRIEELLSAPGEASRSVEVGRSVEMDGSTETGGTEEADGSGATPQ